MDPTHLSYAISFLVAISVSLLATPLVRRYARRIGFVDQPDGGRKAQTSAVALGGGLAVLLSTLLAVVFVFFLASVTGQSPWTNYDLTFLATLLTASTAIVLLGLADDSIGLRGGYKLLGQVLVAGILIWMGLRVEKFAVFGVLFQLGWLAIPFTLFWLLGTVNAINLIDGIDGLASSVGVVLCLTVATINGIQGFYAETIIMLALAGALLGFLRYNFAPASIYLGDTGSMLVGLVIGAIAVRTSVKSPAAIAMAVLVAVWSIPILDSAAAFLRRKLTGRSFFTADRGHLHHSLLVRGWSVRQAALFIAFISATTCIGAVVSVILKNDFFALITVLVVVAFLISTKTFGHIEFALVRDRFRHTAFSSLTGSNSDASRHHESSFRLQGSREWDKLWGAIIESAEEYRLMKFKLSIDMPALHESFFASWQSSDLPKADASLLWKASIPMTLDGQIVGQIEMSGLSDKSEGSTMVQMLQALDFLEPIEDDIRQIRERIEFDHNAVKTRKPSRLRTHETASTQPVSAATPAKT